MDPLAMLDMERRSGISNQDIESFVAKVDAVSDAMEQIKKGTFDPLSCKVPGYKTLEQEELEAKERAKREQERRQRLEAKRLEDKRHEREEWWRRARLRFEPQDEDEQQEESKDQENQQQRAEDWANRVVAAYKSRDANDYSQWAHWEPQDPVTQEEKAQQEALLQKMQNAEFEKNNPEFCKQFQQDLEQRARSQRQREQTAEKFKTKGNQFYKLRKYKEAIENYMKALEQNPFDERVLTNIAQSYLRLDLEEDSLEFSNRALFVNPRHVKALSRRAAVLYRQQKLQEAAKDMEKAIELEPKNDDLKEQFSVIVGDYEDSLTSARLADQLSNQESATAQENSELRFMMEVLNQMKRDSLAKKRDQSTTGTENHGEEQNQMSSSSTLADPCVAYELLVPFLSRTPNVRAMFRTSGEFQVLVDRLIAYTCGIFKESNQEHEANPPADSSDGDGTTKSAVLCSMLECALAALRDDPRNQVVAFRQQGFHRCVFDGILAPLDAWMTNWSITEHMSLSIQLLWLELLDALIETKSWKHKFLNDQKLLGAVLDHMRLPASPVVNDQDRKSSKQLTKIHHQVATISSSMVFTLSGLENSFGLKAMQPLLVWKTCLESLDRKLDQPRQIDGTCELEENLLGILVNFSTEPVWRQELQTSQGNTSLRKHTVKCLLYLLHRQGQSNGCSSCTNCCERALAVLLNMSHSTDSTSSFREELTLQHGVSVLQLLLSKILVAPKENAFGSQQLVVSRATSVLCRLHAVAGDSSSSLKPKDRVALAKACAKQLTSLKLVQTLLNASQMACKLLERVPQEAQQAQIEVTWQLLAQLWCHLGWCVTQDPSIRTWLRTQHRQQQQQQADVMSLAFDLLAKSLNGNPSQHKDRVQATGNLVKWLITMHGDHDASDLKVLFQRSNLALLVECLQTLPDGVSRKNTAILLAKLCQQDSEAKEIVRELRGIEMMMSLAMSSMTKTVKTSQELPRLAAHQAQAF